MPLPKPNKGESEKDYISRAIAFQKREKPDIPNAQAAAIAHDAWRKAKGIKKMTVEEFFRVLHEENYITADWEDIGDGNE